MAESGLAIVEWLGQAPAEVWIVLGGVAAAAAAATAARHLAATRNRRIIRRRLGI